MDCLDFVPWFPPQQTSKDLLEPFAEVLGDQGIDNGVEARVGIRHAVREQAQSVGRLVEWEVSVEIVENKHMVGQPTEAEEDGHNDDHFSHFPLRLLGLRHVH